MYAETDLLLALVKGEDWLEEAAEAVYDAHEERLWTSHHALVELLLVAYREDMDAERVVADAMDLVEVRDDPDRILAAASYVEDHGFTPYDALHLVASLDDVIVSSDESYEGYAPRLDLREVADDD